MNHDAARQKEDDKLWHYTRHNKRTGTYPIGYCADGCPGHATAEDACEHHKQYLLDGATFHDDSPDPQTLHRCEAPDCTNMTDGSARVPGGIISRTLCKEHRNRETLAALISVGESWHS